MLRAADRKYIKFEGRRYSLKIHNWHLGLFGTAELARQARDRFLTLFRPIRKAA